jgi:phage antirepressor YoqD-like protein
MNDLIVNSNQQMMSSKEVAALTDKRHDHVIRDIRAMLEQIQSPDLGSEQYQVVTLPNGMTGEILLDHDLTMLLITGYSVALRMKVIKRWKELEQQVAQPQFAIPTTLSGALMLAAKQAEQIEQQQALLEQQKPAVEFVERYVEAHSSKSIREVAKVLGEPERAFIAWLIDTDVLFRQSGNLLPHANYQHKGYFDVKTSQKNGHAFTQTRFTPEGIAWIAKRVIKKAA